uniref:GNAT family N-acetyltransferase n=1 Tax=Rheinheimera sp. TaxID=1869214 RepID=UPI0040485880
MQLKWLNSLTQVSPQQWDALFTNDNNDKNPFCRHSFLLALEQGGSVGAGAALHHSGWQSQHLTLWQDDVLLAAVPGYIKSHSYGEYLFDWQIADAYRQYQLPYYPKWIAAIPFTPVTGPRFGVLSCDLTDSLLPHICAALKQRLAAQDFCSVQWLYSGAQLQQRLTDQGFLARHDVQFLWHNAGYRQFDDFLQQLDGRKRKQLRKERSKTAGFTLKTLHGDELSTAHWQAVIRCYQATYLKRSGHRGYISEQSFMALAQMMPGNIVVFAAFAGPSEEHNTESIPECTAESMIAAALCFKSGDTLYGRYWGALIDAEHLHFELCYYQGIEYCIQHGLRYFDAGAQGEHKLKRGFAPVMRYGSYLFAETPLNGAITAYFQQETAHLQAYSTKAMQALPYKTT